MALNLGPFKARLCMVASLFYAAYEIKTKARRAQVIRAHLT
ncbi:hypothetical protein FOYG_08771 [Fusarium oxysporum NRRL 32931]|uniref:Uncharacterized protein n=1 Tax=Fusarium oxysporum NRRL 32931 TaxID=660029 RepID=W9IG44_FUSOX|nr:hypothetical protein FOYG_08771 [Fusarium oxysporum NRRL 32931]